MDVYDRRLRRYASLTQGIDALEAWIRTEADRPRALLAQLLTVLEERFEDEEERGYLTDIRVAHPELVRKLEALHAEHADLRERLRSLLDDVERMALPGRLRSSLRALRTHETRERRLLEDAECIDIGTGD